MQLIYHEENRYVIRFDSGEDVIKEVVNFAEDEDIRSATFNGIGATGKLVLSYYNLNEKKYEDHELNERLEIVNLTGTIASMGGEVVVHAHGSFSDSKLAVRAGHVKNLIVSATCEVSLESFEGVIEREFDEETGLNLLQ